MSEQVQYIAVLKEDQFVSGLNKIAGVGTSTWSKLNGMQDKFQAETNASAAGLDKMNSKMKGLNSTGGMLSGTFSALAAGFSIFSLFQFGKSSLSEFDAQAKANAQTMAVLASTNGVAGKSIQDIQGQADKFSKITLFPDDQIQSAENLLLTFTQVRGEIYDQSIPAILDMSTALGQDTKSSAIQLGKALNDPIKGVTALRRVGVAFTDSQEDQIKTLVETGRLQEAQALILKELTTEFGGSARAAYLAAHPLARLSNAFGESKEAIGNLIATGLERLMPAFQWFIDTLDKTAGWMKRNSEWVGILAAWLGSFLGAILLVVTAVKIWTGVQWLLNVAMTANPIGLIIVAVAALVGTIIYLWNTFEGFRGFLIGLWESFKAVFSNIKNLAMNVLGGIGDLLIGIFTFDQEKLALGILKLQTGFQEYGKQVGRSFADGYNQGVDQLAGDETSPGVKGIYAAGGGNPDVPGGDGTGTAQAIGAFAGTENKKNINITIGSLIQKLEFNATNIQSSLEDMKEEVQKVLLSAVNNANMIAG